MPKPIQDPRWSTGVTDALDTKGRTPVEQLDEIAVPTVQMADASRTPWQRAWVGFAGSNNNPHAVLGDHSGVLMFTPPPDDSGQVAEIAAIWIAETALAARTYAVMLINDVAANVAVDPGQADLTAIDRPLRTPLAAGGVVQIPITITPVHTVGIAPTAVAGRTLGFLQSTPNANPTVILRLDPPVRIPPQSTPNTVAGLVVFNNTANQAIGPVTFWGRAWQGQARIRP